MDYKVQLGNIESSTILENIPKDSIGFVLSNLIKESGKKFFMHITTGNFQSSILKKEIEFFCPELKVLVFENWDNLPYDRTSPKDAIQAERLKTLNNIIKYSGDKKVLIITTINAVLQRVIPKEILKKSHMLFGVGDKISQDILEKFLMDIGYKKVSTAISIGEFSINNNVVDLIANENKCYRVEFFNNVVKGIKKFNPVSQVSLNNVEKVNLIPRNEVIFSKEYISNFKQNYRELFGIPKANDALYEAVSNDIFYNGIENYLPLFYDNKLDTIFDYLPEGTYITLDDNIEDKKVIKLDLISQHYRERVDNVGSDICTNPILPKLLYLDNDELQSRLESFVNIRFIDGENLSDARNMNLGISATRDFYKESQKNNGNVFEELKKV